MRVLVTGAGGMLGRDLCAGMREAGHDVTAATRQDLDITDATACQVAVHGHDLVVNAAAWTAVDDAESHETEAFAVNAVGPANVARACESAGARMVQISTDYVFAGDATSPYAENAPVAPVSAYGRSKAAGESAVRAYAPQSWVVRSAWLYGAHGGNFVRTMARLAETSTDRVPVVDDQRGQPTSTVDLATMVVRLVDSEAPFGTYHGTSSGETTWCGLARAVFELLGHDAHRVTPTTTAAFPRPAHRPAYSVLGHHAWALAGLPRPPDWRESLEREIADVVGLAA